MAAQADMLPSRATGPRTQCDVGFSAPNPLGVEAVRLKLACVMAGISRSVGKGQDARRTSRAPSARQQCTDPLVTGSRGRVRRPGGHFTVGPGDHEVVAARVSAAEAPNSHGACVGPGVVGALQPHLVRQLGLLEHTDCGDPFGHLVRGLARDGLRRSPDPGRAFESGLRDCAASTGTAVRMRSGVQYRCTSRALSTCSSLTPCAGSCPVPGGTVVALAGAGPVLGVSGPSSGRAAAGTVTAIDAHRAKLVARIHGMRLMELSVAVLGWGGAGVAGLGRAGPGRPGCAVGAA